MSGEVTNGYITDRANRVTPEKFLLDLKPDGDIQRHPPPPPSRGDLLSSQSPSGSVKKKTCWTPTSFSMLQVHPSGQVAYDSIKLTFFFFTRVETLSSPTHSETIQGWPDQFLSSSLPTSSYFLLPLPISSIFLLLFTFQKKKKKARLNLVTVCRPAARPGEGIAPL